MSGLQRARTLLLSGTPAEGGKSVLYVMSRDQRVTSNHALLAAQEYAQQRKLPLAVLFCLQASSGFRAREHFDFMLEGLREVEENLKNHNIPFLLLIGKADERLSGAFGHLNPAAVFFDFNPLRGPLALQKKLAKEAQFEVYCVDTHNIVPLWFVSDKQEVAARTIRPKIHKLLSDFLVPGDSLGKHPVPWPGTVMTMNQLGGRINDLLEDIPRNNIKISIRSGESAANKILHEFVAQRLQGYGVRRNDPSKQGLSELSPYLHFGQLSSLQAVVAAVEATSLEASLQTDLDVFVEEIVVRKELSDNYCFFNKQYDSLAGAPEWARKTLDKHQSDKREFLYTLDQFEQAETHDTAWNAAQKQLTSTGKMHGYMRMYWAKKVLEWSESPEQAVHFLIRLNDFYSLDGGDPNGYVGILWSVAGLHDRPWGERAVYGTVRSMVYSGLKRKFDVEEYIKLNG